MEMNRANVITIGQKVAVERGQSGSKRRLFWSNVVLATALATRVLTVCSNCTTRVGGFACMTSFILYHVFKRLISLA